MSSFFSGLVQAYGPFFSLQSLSNVLSDPVSWGVIGSLMILEGLLSADNALVLAVMVRHLPKKQQRKALFYGILGAYLFRFVAIGIGVYLVQIMWVKVLGGAYLLWMSLKHFLGKDGDGDEEVKAKPKSFWRTVLTVELMDIAFSIDSVLAAFGVSNKVWVLFIGGVLGVLMMRGVAQVFLKLIERVPELETTAFVLIALIGVRMIAGAFGFEVPDLVFFSILIAVFLGTFVIHMVNKKSSDNGEKNTIK
ncbi:TerC family protein [Aneurinibacillus terranovensis]|uniref:TerC family protein n=1 Tax=Aneurinibacillus terranovensis TaxID=278991 RepID=UPI0004049494|nr:TerC family protein [Aneurinibacillus terranovensis]